MLYRDDMSYCQYGEQKDKYMQLKDIKDYWDKKYPNVVISIWESTTKDCYHGIMTGRGKKVNIKANSLGELISQGEEFLRKVN